MMNFHLVQVTPTPGRIMSLVSVPPLTYDAYDDMLTLAPTRNRTPLNALKRSEPRRVKSAVLLYRTIPPSINDISCCISEDSE
jgi:hypothetical protein